MEFPSAPLPKVGLTRDQVLAQLAALKTDDRKWEEGKVFGLVYDAGPDHHSLLRDAMALFEAENGLNVLAFPSLGQMSHDLVRITATLLGADDPRSGGEVTGFLTSGGTESLLQACVVARDHARARGVARPTIVCATSAHAAFTKAAGLFDVEVIRVPVDTDYRVDLSAMERAIDERTAMLVASAVSYPQGVIDDVSAIAALATSRGLLCHVDACMGGFFLPFLTELGHCDVPFDFTVDGVTSMSADLHKYGYASKGASVVLYRTAALARHQVFMTEDWLGGFYASTTMAGTKPAGPIAAAWASVMHLGHDGLLTLTSDTYGAARTIIEWVDAHPKLELRGNPAMSVFAFGAANDDDLDIFAVSEVLSRSGWHVDRQRHPDSLHLTVHAGSVKAADAFVADLSAAITEVGTRRTDDRSTTYATGD
jgi:glutamate/tyrosine decarboxylase-like PLP-dependent enzyme